MRVCQFRHIRDCKSYYTKKKKLCQYFFENIFWEKENKKAHLSMSFWCG